MKRTDNYDRIASPKASDCRKEGTDENVTLLGAGTENDLKTEFVGNDQLEQETYRMEQSNENLRTSQKFATGEYEKHASRKRLTPY